jgi:hypothetical protein
MTSKQKREAAQARHQFTAENMNAKASDLIFSIRLLRWDADGLAGETCYAARKEVDAALTALENLRRLTRQQPADTENHNTAKAA